MKRQAPEFLLADDARNGLTRETACRELLDLSDGGIWNLLRRR